ncbi:uncharacterized protein AC631_00435 [Debaryomyces fabryi]|uniref:tRNA dimethylallyltransferase n=1 Tax=Debaryomyces fabryi TaxID=58627 RepID=A0A0V1Q5N4_9ASCO|nr:uncharacterized protein AC631_00435 [Debaryomyces fabryi]KSA03800.1 hypothetical protein AC631_00435 [Debaryomyces fabryi]CUM45319.1 unnamed protein product [Debaryomyces fabryi]
MQVYKKLDIITNKHPLKERDGITHHVMDHVNWNEEYFIHRFSKEANNAIEDIHSRGKIPIIIGGTHYYLQNLLFKNKTVGENINNSKVTRELTKDDVELLDGPVAKMFDKLRQIDPIIAEKFHPEDKRKLRRALEIYMTTGQKPSEIYHEQKLDELEDTSLRYNTLLFWVYSDPEILKDRLDKRVDNMMELGALDEINELYEFYRAQVPVPDCTTGIWQVIGFKEFLPWLESTGSLNKEESSRWFNQGVDRMKIRTRQYAKYQVKWIKKLLAVELNKEARFNFKYGGKLYLLDASDLGSWNEKVREVGLSIANQFLTTGPSSVTHVQAPEHLQDIFPDNSFLDNINSNKKLGSEKNWKHYECKVCKDKQGKNLIAVGEENWQIHLKSRRHKRQLGSGERKRKHEQMINQYKKLTPTSEDSLYI